MSGLRGRARHFLSRVRKWRRRRYQLSFYNGQRQLYYANSTRKQVASKLKVSIVVPCYNPPIAFFEDLLSSVYAQSYANWELVLADGSSQPDISRFIKERSAGDTRIVYHKLVNEGIAATTNVGLSLATGDLISFLDHDDTLDPDALAYAVEQFEAFPEVGLVYTDEDKLSSDGGRYQDPHFKPDFSIDLLRDVNYITHFVTVRASLVEQVGGIRVGFEGAQDYDFLLRIVDTGTTIHHVPRILYHWRLSESSTAADFSNKEHITNSGAKAVNEHYERRGIKNLRAEAIKNRPGFYITRYGIAPAKRAVVLALPAETAPTVADFIAQQFSANQSLIDAKVEILIQKTFDKHALAAYDSVMVVRDLIMPGNIKSPLTQLFAIAEQDGVGGVSPKLVSDGKIDDMGLVTTGSNNLLTPLFLGMEDHDANIFGSHEWARNVTALTGRVYVVSQAALKKLPSDGPIMGHGGRLIIWAHIEMLSLVDLTPRRLTGSQQDRFYNSNLSANFTPMMHRNVYAADLMKESAPANTGGDTDAQ